MLLHNIVIYKPIFVDFVYVSPEYGQDGRYSLFTFVYAHMRAKGYMPDRDQGWVYARLYLKQRKLCKSQYKGYNQPVVYIWQK